MDTDRVVSAVGLELATRRPADANRSQELTIWQPANPTQYFRQQLVWTQTVGLARRHFAPSDAERFEE